MWLDVHVAVTQQSKLQVSRIATSPAQFSGILSPAQRLSDHIPGLSFSESQPLRIASSTGRCLRVMYRYRHLLKATH